MKRQVGRSWTKKTVSSDEKETTSDRRLSWVAWELSPKSKEKPKVDAIFFSKIYGVQFWLQRLK